MKYPYLNFKILDNPYNCSKNIFKYNFTIPFNFYVHNSYGDISVFKMFREPKFASPLNIFNKVKTLLQEHAINNQTLYLDTNSIKIIHLDSIHLNPKHINSLTIIPNYDRNNNCTIVEKDKVSDSDIQIPLFYNLHKEYINKPVWIDFNKIDKSH